MRRKLVTMAAVTESRSDSRRLRMLSKGITDRNEGKFELAYKRGSRFQVRKHEKQALKERNGKEKFKECKDFTCKQIIQVSNKI